MGNGSTELREKNEKFHFVNIPTTEDELNARKTSNKGFWMPRGNATPLDSEAFDVR